MMVAIGIIYSKSSKGITSFTVGKRNAGAWISALSYGTAYFSAVMFVGYSGSSGWDFGLWAVLIGIGNAIFGSFFAWKLLANRTREVSRRMKIKSMPQFFANRYQSRGMKTFSAVIIFLFLVPYSASVYKGLTSVCSVLLGIDDTICMILIAALSAIILVVGGYLATLKADFVQGIIMMVGVAALIFFVMRSDVVQSGGGIAGMWDYMKAHGMQPMGGSQWTMLLSTVFMTSFGTWGLPQMIHKYYGIKDAHEVKRATVISTVFALLVAGGGYFIGSFSHLFFGADLPAQGKDYVIPLMLKQSALPSILLGVILVLLISASVSTLSSITLTASSTFSMDLVRAKFKPDISDKGIAGFNRVLCLVFVVLSYLIANTNTPILDMMSYSWGIISGSFLAPYALALYWKKLNRPGAWAGMIDGFALALIPALSKIILLCMGNTSPALLQNLAAKGPVFAVAAMLLSIVLCFAVSAATQRSHPAQEYKAFYEAKAE